MRLKAGKIHWTTAVAQRQQEWIAQRAFGGRDRRHGSFLRWLNRESRPTTPSLSQTIEVVYIFFSPLRQPPRDTARCADTEISSGCRTANYRRMLRFFVAHAPQSGPNPVPLAITAAYLFERLTIGG
jgi:hypothetical protein